MKVETTNAAPPATPPQLWQGLDDYMSSPAFREAMADEFPEDAAEWTDPVTRRNFMTIMGASLALAGAAGCSPRPAPQRKLVPYSRQPEQIVPGVPLFFATACTVSGYAAGVLVRSHEGRPVKVEGNPDHPANLGGTNTQVQASVLDLYDPDRSQLSTRSGQPASYEDVIRAVRRQLFDDRGQAKKGVRLRVLTGAVTSPTLSDRITALLNDFPEARWTQFEPCGQDNVRAGTQRAFGRELNVVYDFKKADVILSLDADFLASGPGQLRYSKDFGTRRRVRQVIPEGQEAEYTTPERMNRLYVVECMPSCTGSVADHRLPLLSGQVETFARELAAKLGVAGAPTAGPLPEVAGKWLDAVANDLRTRRGTSVVVAGEHQPASVHALAHAINAALGNVGQTVTLTSPVEARPAGKMVEFPALVAEMANKAVDALLILGGTNPAYTAPADLDFAAAVKSVPLRFHLGCYQDETAALCEWHVNEAHYLEAWGDGRGFEGTAAIQQPLIAPLYQGKSPLEVLADLTNAATREGREIVRNFWRGWAARAGQSGDFEPVWQEAVRAGVVKGTALTPTPAALAGNWAEGAAPASPAPAGDVYEINFRPDPTLHDGRFANNGWLQEVPKPVTKLTWDNAAFVSPATALGLGATKDFRWTAGERGRTEVSVLVLEYKGRRIKAPVWILPGHPDGAVTVHLGHGRPRAGRVGNSESELNADGKAARGFNAYALQTAAAPAFDTGLKLAKTGDTYFLACTQAQWVMTQIDPINGHVIDRAPVRRGSLGDYQANPSFAKIPPTAAGETAPITNNIPGPTVRGGDQDSGTQGRNGTSYGPAHVHTHGADGKPAADHQEGHDHRIVPLTMYNPNDALYPAQIKPARRWGMAIDLGVCIGCNSCMVACQSENNTPVVGKYEVTRGHEMYWIRVDRYYEGTPDHPDASRTFFQPVPCQQCEKAPCEIVCPVAATAHSADGLNDMVYNRCVGTRYCSNNCPYKVRRFNFLTFQDWATTSLKLGRNPDVSVRSRGVMEKCTYCVQRIRYAEIAAEREHREIRDGEVRTACQTACPTGAIMFGDLNDAVDPKDPSGAKHKRTEVGHWKAEPANYGLLAELNTMPRTSYLASLRNPNPEMPKGA